MFEKIVISIMLFSIGLSLNTPSPSELRKDFDEAQRLFVLEDYPQAIQKYEKILNTNSPLLNEDSVITILSDEYAVSVVAASTYQLGNAHKKAERFGEAMDYFRRVEENRDVDVKLRTMSQYQIMLTLYDQEDYNGVIREGERLIERYPQSRFVERARYNTGWAYFKSERYPEAVAAFEAQLNSYPSGEYAARAQYQIGQSYFEHGDYERAIQGYQTLIDKHTPEKFTERMWSDAQLKKLRVRSQVEGGLGGTREEQDIIELSAKAHLQIGDSYARMNRPAEAIDAYMVVTLDYLPLNDLVEMAFLKIGEVAGESQGLDEAIGIYRDAIDESEDRVFRGKLQFHIGKLMFEAEKYEQAIEEFDLYLSAYDDVAGAVGFTLDEARYQIAQSHFELSEFEAALPHYQAVADSFPASSLKAEGLFGAGLCLQRLERYDEGIQVFRRIRTEHPRRPQAPLALLQIGRIYADRDDYAPAIQTFREVLDNYADNVNIDTSSVFYELGITYRDQGDQDTALVYFHRVDQASDYFVPAYSEVSEIYLERGEHQRAEQVLQTVLDVVEDPARKAETHYYLARLYVSMEDFARAGAAFDQALPGLTNDQMLQSALFGRGVVRLQAQDYPGAIQDLERLLASERGNAGLRTKARRRLITAYTRNGQPEKARSFAEAVVEDATTDLERGDALLLLAQVQYEQRAYDECLSTIAAVDTLDLEETELPPQAAFLKGNALLAQSRYDEAIGVFGEAEQRFPESPIVSDIRYQLGIAYYNSAAQDPGRYQEAAKTFSRLVETAESQTHRMYGHYYRAYSYFRLGEWALAARDFARVARDFPGSDLADEARFQVAECWYNEKAFEKAYAAYMEALRTSPKSQYADDALYNAAWSKIQSGDEPGALSLFERLAVEFPDSDYAVDALFTLGDYHYNKRQYADARRAYERVIADHPEHDLAAKSRELIHEMEQITSYQEYEKAMALFDAEELSGAIEALKEVIAKYPDADVVVGARTNIAASYEQLRKWEDALKWYQSIIDDYEGDPRAQDAYQFALDHRDWIKENY